MSSLLKALHTDRPLNGVYIGDTGAAVMEIAIHAGFDYIRIDREHSLLDAGEVREMIRIADGYQVPVLVRTPSLEDMTRLLDFGATGILLPDVQTAQQAAQAVAACKYAPIGSRGICRIGRCTRYTAVSGPDYYQSAEENVCLGVQIESEEGLVNLEEILAVPGVDLVTVGPEDMAQAMGIWGQTQHPKILDAQKYVLEISHRHGKPVMLSAGSPKRYAELKQMQADLLTIAFDTSFLMDAFRQRIEQFSQIAE